MNILPCPFCGHSGIVNAEWANDFDKTWQVACVSCGAAGPWGGDTEHALELWNQRVLMAHEPVKYYGPKSDT